MLHDAILKRKGVLDQLASGLSILGLLDVVKCFPVEFEPLFTYQHSQMLDAEQMMQLFQFPDNPTSAQAEVISMFKQFVRSSKPEGQCTLGIYRLYIHG